MTRSTTALLVFLAALLSSPVLGDGLIVVDRPLSMPPVRFPFAPLEVKYHRVEVEIEDQVARTSVDQVFVNPTGQRLEGHYLFPVPRGARLDRFAMDIDGRETEAKLLSAEDARRIYLDIVRRMRDPALLEYAEQDLLKVRVFPIEPHSEKRIRLRYTELLPRDGELVQYLYPLNTEKFSARPVKDVSLKVEIHSRRALKSLYSPSHRVEVRRHGTTSALVGFETNDARPDTDFRLLFSQEAEDQDEVSLDLLTYEDFFLLLASPGILSSDRVLPKDLVLVLDTSGSMAGRKLEQAKKALELCLSNLGGEDRFEIISFATEADAAFGSLLPASVENVRRARRFLEDARPIGGTAFEEALRAAAESLRRGDGKRPAAVVFLTDGRPTIGLLDDDEILLSLRRSLGDRGARVFSFGIGNDINTHLLDRIAEETGASTRYVSETEDLELVVSSFYRKISRPVLTDLRLDFGSGIRPHQVHPRQLPDLFEGSQLVLMGRFRGSGTSTVTLEGRVEGSTRRISRRLRFQGGKTGHDYVPRLWAARRIGFLLDQIRLHGEQSELRQEVTELAREYGIVTPYTSYLITEDERRRGVPMPSQTLRGLQEDGRARKEAEESYGHLKGSTSGVDAVTAARSSQGLRKSESLADQDVWGAESQGPRYVQGKAFYPNGRQWVDGEVQSQLGAPRQRIRFGSEAYMDLLGTHPEAQAWLSLGQEVVLSLEGEIYEIFD